MHQMVGSRQSFGGQTKKIKSGKEFNVLEYFRHHECIENYTTGWTILSMDDNLWEPRELYWKIYAHGLAIERSIHGGIYITNAWNVDGCLMFFPNPY